MSRYDDESRNVPQWGDYFDNDREALTGFVPAVDPDPDPVSRKLPANDMVSAETLYTHGHTDRAASMDMAHVVNTARSFSVVTEIEENTVIVHSVHHDIEDAGRNPGGDYSKIVSTHSLSDARVDGVDRVIATIHPA